MAKMKELVVPEIIDSVDGLVAKMNAMREAQKIFATYTQEQVDKIFFAAASAADKMRLPLAKMAVEETGMGVVEDKVIKNNYAAEYIYNAYKDTKTVGVIEEDKAYGIKKIAEPIGLIAAVIPTTNPTSTAIFKSLICLKTRNAIIISPHPRAKNCTIEAARIVLEAAVKAGAPAGIIGWIDVPSRGYEKLRPDPGHRRPRHGEGGVLLRQTRPGRWRGKYPGYHRRHRGHQDGRQLHHPLQDL